MCGVFAIMEQRDGRNRYLLEQSVAISVLACGLHKINLSTGR